MSEQIITIEVKRYHELLNAERKLSALEAGGVDNWEWYFESLKDAGVLDEEDEDSE